MAIAAFAIVGFGERFVGLAVATFVICIWCLILLFFWLLFQHWGTEYF
jgi:hypothetical protein